ncbi:MoaD/ThiS family protein [Chloroflexota bacterium]
MIKCIVEMFGLAREVSELPEIEIGLEKGAGLSDVVAALRREIPALEGPVIRKGEDRLEDSVTFNIDGRFYHNDNGIELKDGDHLRLLTLAIGG